MLKTSTKTCDSLFDINKSTALGPTSTGTGQFGPMIGFVKPFCLRGNERRARALGLPVCINSMHTVMITKRSKTCKGTRGATFMQAPLVLLSALPHMLDVRRRVAIPIGIFTVRGRIGGIAMSLRTSNNKIRVRNSRRRSLAFGQPNSRLIFFALGAKGGAKGTAVGLATDNNKRRAGRAVRVRMQGPGPVIALHDDR